MYLYGLLVYFDFLEGYAISLLSAIAIASYFIAKAVYPSVENWIRKRERKKEEFEREKREIIEELKKLVEDYDEKR